MLGIRYLDIRVYKEGNIYWTHHGGYLMVRLETVITDVINFVVQTNKEVIIFDIHENKKPGFEINFSYKLNSLLSFIVLIPV